MKKRLIALALCLVMLATCLGAGVDVLSGDLVPDEVPTVTEVPDAEPVPTDADAEPVPTDTAAEPDSTLYDKLMACKTSDEFEAIAEAAGDEQISALTETELAALEAHYAQIQADAEVTKEEYPIPAVNYTNVAPFLPPVSGQVRMLRAASFAAPRAAANYAANDTATDSGMEISKTATANADGSYTITLEAYATGEKVTTVVTEDIPTDIILVLDQSGSMDFCIVCGNAIDGYYDYHDTYVATTSINTNKTYYIKSGNDYTEVQYCSGTHGVIFQRKCEGGAGWYGYYDDHTTANKITPKTSDNPEGTQFYEYKSEACSSRLSALKTAVTNFANAVAKKAAGKDGDIATTGDNINHRIAMVGFASSGTQYNSNKYENTEVFVGATQYTYGTSAQSQYGKALQSMDTAAGKNNITSSIGALDAYGGTFTNLGMEMANGIFEKNPIPDGKKRNRVIIVFTDGYPGTSSTTVNSTVANDAVSEGYIAKKSTADDGYGATVYTVGIFSGADGRPVESFSGVSDPNKFMHLLSSNYKNAQSYSDSSKYGTATYPAGGGSYYLSAADADSLNSIFQQISDQIEDGGSSSTLTADAVVKDIISPQFTLPAGTQVDDITLETYQCTGKNGDVYTWSKNGDAMGATATINGDQVSVTGFNFSENWVGTETNAGNTSYRGNKLVISFKVQPKAGFLGGNDVYTNTSAGVYENGSDTDPVLSFPRPQVNVPIKDVTVTANDKNVYLMGEVTADQLKAGAEVKVGNVKLDLSKENYGLESWQTEYVNITVTVKDKDGNAISDKLADLTEDTTYTVEVTVAPKTQGTSTPEKGNAATAKTGVNNPAANVYVFKPELTFQDSAIDLGQTPNYATENFKSVVWKHGDENADNVTMTGNAPELSYTYSPAANAQDAFKTDTYVNVTVKIGDTELSKGTDVTFKHQKIDYCNSNNCSFDSNKGQFIVHIKTFDLTIIKSITRNESKLYGSQDFVFNVECVDKNIDIDVVVNVPDDKTQGSVTIKGLPVGTYTVTENTGWSWRYKLQGVVKADGATGTLDYEIGSSSATYTPSGTNHQIIFTNNWVQAKWLSFTDSVKNIFGKPNT